MPRFTGGPGSADPGQFTWLAAPLWTLLQTAYHLESYQLIGPPWIKNDRYDIAGKVPAGATREQFNVMLQNLLAERFGLQVHKETREIPVYDLVVAKGGSKLKESEKSPAGAPLPALSGRWSQGLDKWDSFPLS